MSNASRCNVNGRSREGKKAIEFLEKTIKLSEGRYEVGLLWLDDEKIPNKYYSAYTQLCSVEHRLQKDSNLRQRYESTVQVDSDNLVRKLEAQELEATKIDPQWYVPHHSVINPNKPEKVRRVCNAASKCKGVALNDKLMSGPDLLQNLVGILLRFRELENAMTADIELKLFLQVELPPAYCKFLRFLWSKHIKNVVEVYECTRHLFGAKIPPTLANHALQQTGIDNKTLHPLASRAIERNFYIDNFAKSVATKEEAIELYQQLKQSLCNGGLNLTKWLSISTAVMESFDDADKVEKTIKSFEVEPSAASLLGFQWNMEDDSL